MKIRRIGTFKIDMKTIEVRPEAVRTIMGQCVIVRAEQRYDLDAIQYHATSEQFAAVELGRVSPEYTWTIAEIDIGLYRVTAEIVK